MNRPAWRRCAAPMAMIVFGFWMLGGCLFIPTFNSLKTGQNASTRVGAPDSGKPLRVGTATRAGVEGMLGPAPYRTEDERVLAYAWEVRNGIWIWPLCAAAYEQSGYRTLALRFDEQGVLRSFELLKRNGNWMHNRPFMPALPPEIEQEQQRRRLEQSRHRASQPATREAIP